MSFLKHALNAIGLLSDIQLRRRWSVLAKWGWFRTFRTNMSIDRAGNPLPMLSYSAIDFLSERVGPAMTVFEYGSGNGTLWWAAHVKRVVAVDHDRTWYDRLVPLVPRNVQLLFVSLDDGDRYSQTSVATGELFDVIVIDGRDRVRSARAAVHALKPDGVIIWDDMNREKYREGRVFLAERGFRIIPFTGIGPAGVEESGTVVFYRPNNCLGI